MITKNFYLAILIVLVPVRFLWAQNYEESLAGSYQLPEVLTTQSGEKVTSPGQWETTRRPELLSLFKEHVYGQVPEDFDKFTYEVINFNNTSMDGKATLKETAIVVNRNNASVTIHLKMFVPNNTEKPVPIFLVINHRGHKTMDVSRKEKDGFWPAEEVIEAGYAIAGFDVADVAPDNNDKYADEVLKKLYPGQLEMNDGMQALGAWAWGASRVIDYLEKDKLIDATKVISVGHSRGGKAALWHGAIDKRVAITISNESGNSGAALSRRNFGETVERITKSFPYWFSKNYQQYAGNEHKLPVDQHMLIALIAPRAVYVASAAEDLWADPKGQYLALIEAQPVYELYGFNRSLPAEMPEVNEQIIRLPLGFHNREGKHNMTPFDWHQFITFADAYFGQQ